MSHSSGSTGSAGSALVSLMMALTLSTTIALSAMRLIAQSNADYQRVEQWSLIEDQATYAIEIMTRALQQAGHVDVSLPMGVVFARPFDGAVFGIDNSTVASGSPAIDIPIPGAHLGSDVLVIRFAGHAAGMIRNCAGFIVPPSLNGADDKGISIFHVALDGLNEPELRCKYRGPAQWSSQTIATGVESFQVLFGIDTDGDELPNDFISASRLSALEAPAAASALSLRTRIVAVEVALLMRSPQVVTFRGPLQTIDMFGLAYSRLHGGDDPGTRIAPSQLAPRRLHRRYGAVIFLSNSLRPDA